jgi:hypothetical protein
MRFSIRAHCLAAGALVAATTVPAAAQAPLSRIVVFGTSLTRALDSWLARSVATAAPMLAMVMVLLVTVCNVHAQVISALANVSKETQPGDTLTVQHMDGRRTSVDLREISADGVLLAIDGKMMAIPAAEIRELGVTSDSLKNGALIGLATARLWGCSRFPPRARVEMAS